MLTYFIALATLASKAAGKAEHEAIMMADVEVQTAVSIAPDTDLVSLLQKVLQLNEPGSSPSVGCAAHESPGIAFFEAGAQQVKQPYPHSSLFLCVSCHQAHSLNRYSRRSMFIEAASMETIKDVPNSSEDNSSSQDVLYQSARETLSTQREEVEDAETFAEDFGLPVSWATEAVVCSYSQQDASMQEVDQPTSRPHHCSGTDLTELFDRADITPIKNLSHCLGTSHHLDPVSPVAAGRTSPEAGAFQQHLQLSFTVDDESTRDACGIPQRRRQGSRQQAMLSPRLSPIPRASGHSPMDDEFGYSNDYDFSD
uniref:Stc1 domain-containing protein n=1 Tax=Mesocestoides corti TaxID=53468 RepID=A0A5K3F500_MESCO